MIVLDVKDFIFIGLGIGMLAVALLGWLGIYPKRKQERVAKRQGITLRPNWLGIVMAMASGGLIYSVISEPSNDTVSRATLSLTILVSILATMYFITYLAERSKHK